MSRLTRYYLPPWLSIGLNAADLATYFRWFHVLFSVLHFVSLLLHALAVTHHAHHARHAWPRRPAAQEGRDGPA